jgi:hypothetical protein
MKGCKDIAGVKGNYIAGEAILVRQMRVTPVLVGIQIPYPSREECQGGLLSL